VTRYFFHIRNTTVFRDHVGVELPDDRAAKAEAARVAGQILLDDGAQLRLGEVWIVQCEHSGRPVCTLSIGAD
jgi:hypothetical protein